MKTFEILRLHDETRLSLELKAAEHAQLVLLKCFNGCNSVPEKGEKSLNQDNKS